MPRIEGVNRLLAAIVLPLAALTLVGLLLLWPDGNGPQDRNLDNAYSGGTMMTGTVASVDRFRCEAASAPPGGPTTSEANDGDTDGSDGREEDGALCSRATVKLDDQPGTEAVVDIPSGIDNVEPGVVLRLLHATVGPPDNRTEYYAFIDFQRSFPMGVLAFAYAALAIAVARIRGLRALVGLVVAFGVLGLFMLPALLEGKPPVLVGLAGSTAIMLVVLYLAHGFSARTTVALLGTMVGLAVTAVLGAWATGGTRLSGLSSEESSVLHLASNGTLDLSAIVLCGIILAGLGVLNDVTITQASAVWELHGLQPSMSARKLFAGAMRIGRDHIASTIYTIAFAYAGAALPTLLLLALYERPFGLSVTSGELAEEVVRTLVGSIGLVLAIPLTTGIAVIVVTAAARGGGDDDEDQKPFESPPEYPSEGANTPASGPAYPHPSHHVPGESGHGEPRYGATGPIAHPGRPVHPAGTTALDGGLFGPESTTTPDRSERYPPDHW